MVIELSADRVLHTRQVYNFMELLGDYGGFEYIFMMIFGLFLKPVAEHSFLLTAIKKLF